MERPLGVKYRAVVNLSPAPSFSGKIVWTDPFPKLCVPRTTASLVILNGSSHDLGSARASAIDEDNQRIIRKGPLGMGVEFHLLLLSSSLHGNDKTRFDEAIRNLDRLIEKASRVVPEIEDQSLQRALALVSSAFMALSNSPSVFSWNWESRI